MDKCCHWIQDDIQEWSLEGDVLEKLFIKSGQVKDLELVPESEGYIWYFIFILGHHHTYIYIYHVIRLSRSNYFNY